MSSIPSSAMPHAKVHDDETPTAAKPAVTQTTDWIDDATDAAKAGLESATDAVKSHPKTAFAVGATVIAGIAAAFAAPALRAKTPVKTATTRKPAAKKSPAKRKPAVKKSAA